jgi:hypothetical protein
VAGRIRADRGSKVKHFGLSEANARDDPSRPRRPIRSQRFRVSIRFGGELLRRRAADSRGTRHCFVPYSPLGRGYLTGKIDTNTTFDPSPIIRSRKLRFTLAAIKANQVVVDLLAQIGDRERPNARADRARLAAGSKPWIVPIPAAGSGAPGREHRRSFCRTHARRPVKNLKVPWRRSRIGPVLEVQANDWSLSGKSRWSKALKEYSCLYVERCIVLRNPTRSISW